MARRNHHWKLAGDEFLIAVDFRTWPIQAGETVVATNARGSLGVVVRDADGADVTGDLVVGAPVIDSVGVAADPVAGIAAIPPDVRVFVFIYGGTTGQTYFFELTAPTSDGELLTHIEPWEVRAA